MGVLRLEHATAVKNTDAHQRVDASSEGQEVYVREHGESAEYKAKPVCSNRKSKD